MPAHWPNTQILKSSRSGILAHPKDSPSSALADHAIVLVQQPSGLRKAQPHPHPDSLHAGVLTHPALTGPAQQRQGHLPGIDAALLD